MFWSKQRKEIDKEILGGKNIYKNSDGDSSVIDVKIDSKEQLFSAYSYSGDKLNPEFSEYIFDKAKRVPVKEDVKIKIHTADAIDSAEVDQAVKSHYRSAYIEGKKEVSRVILISIIMTLLGIIALTALILINHFTDNLYITSIVEIAAWVFIWEAVDYFFLQRPVVKAKCILIQRIYTSKIEICTDEKKTKNA